MKMGKRILVMAMAAIVMLASTVSVLAKGSRNGNVTVVEDDGGYVLTQKIEKAEDYKELLQEAPKAAEAIAEVNKGTADMKDFTKNLQELKETMTDEAARESLEQVIVSLQGKEFVTGFFDLYAKENTKKNENGNYQVILSVPAMTENTVEVEVLHYSTERKLWETITPLNVDKKNKTITVEFKDFSPIAIIAKEGTFSTDILEQVQGTSPKTEGTSAWILWAAGAILLGAAAFFVSGRKYDK